MTSYKPKIHTLELTNYCNLSGQCATICPHHLMKRPKGFVSLELAKDVLDYASTTGQKDIRLTHFGEPFLHPQWYIIVNYAKEVGLKPFLSTNATYLSFTEEQLRTLDGVLLQVSIDDFKVRDWEYFKWGLERLINAGAEVVLTGIVVSQKRKEEAEKLAEKYNIPLVISPKHDWHGSYGKPERSHLWDKFDICPIVKYNWYTVLWDGTVVPCCLIWDNDVVLGKWEDLKAGRIKHQYPYKGVCDKCHMVYATEDSTIGIYSIAKKTWKP